MKNRSSRIIRSISFACFITLVFFCGLPLHSTQNNKDWRVIVDPDNSVNFIFVAGEDIAFSVNLAGWGPNWQWVGLESKEKTDGDELKLTIPFIVNQSRQEIILVRQRVWRSATNQISFNYELSAEVDVPLTSIIANIKVEKNFQNGEIIFEHTDGTKGQIPLTIGGPGQQSSTSNIIFNPENLQSFNVTLDPPLLISNHGDLRVQLAENLFKAGNKSITITFHFPEMADLVVDQTQLKNYSEVIPGADWFPVTGSHNMGKSVIGFEDWLDKPAGVHGGARIVGDHFEFTDGTKVKFWGTNLSYGQSAPEKNLSTYTADRFAKYGVNAVRLHKFTGAGWEGIGDEYDVTKMEPKRLDEFDYFANELIKNGVYYGWSHTFGLKPKPDNAKQLLAYDEIIRNNGGNTYALINFAEDVQDLMIEMVVNLLNHTNPYTGKTYAQDPALVFIELQNEDDIFFYTTNDAYEKYPTYRKKLLERYSSWLKNKYTNQEGLKAAWGDDLRSDETFDSNNIALQPNPWYMGADNLRYKEGFSRQRLLDNAAFFHEVQNAFYEKFAKAIRDTGYQGPLIGSSWQAPEGLPHYYNLKSDALVGYIDRHNYFGGSLNDTILNQPGGGLLSTGLQQVYNLPFGISEWIYVYPSLYSAEGAALLAVYGMGLQNWSASYEFQSATINKNFSDIVGNFPWGVWNVDVPTQIGQYPALARMIMRGDIKEGDIIGVRTISPENLAAGKFNFTEKIEQQGDLKKFSGDTPQEALAAGRILIKFTDQNEPSIFPDMSQYQVGKSVVSTTKQLTWDYSDKGFFTVDTDGTKAVVGFAQNRDISLSNYRFLIHSPYASIFLTSLEKNHDLSEAKSALLTAVARNSNSNYTIFTVNQKTLENGQKPIMMEPVKATITCGRELETVNVLDMNGQRTGSSLPVNNNTFTIDSALEKTIYYEIIFKP